MKKWDHIQNIALLVGVITLVALTKSGWWCLLLGFWLSPRTKSKA